MKAVSGLIFGLILSAVSWAHGDEDHGAAPHPAPQVQAAPSAESASSEFEVLATMDGEMLTLYLNHFADNQPVANAQIEVESGSFKTQLKAVASGVYQAKAAPLSKVGEHALAISLTAGNEADLLDASLSIASAPIAANSSSTTPTGGFIAGAVGLVIASLVMLRRNKGAKK